MNEPIHILSLGAGVQSSTLALMAAAGEVGPMPQAAIFADTLAEPKEVYEWLDWLEARLPFPVLRVSRKGAHPTQQVIQWNHSQIPAFQNGSPGKRQCTKHWKIVPTQRGCREFTNTKRKRLPDGFITLWMGISRDEIIRMKPSREAWITHHWPLIDLGFTRAMCLEWMERKGFPKPPRSACVYCPYKTDEEWSCVVADPDSALVIREVEKLLLPRGESLHSEGGSVFDIDFSKSPKDRRSHKEGQMMLHECEGMCGV